jgi:RHS repeat-associated protein
VNQQTGQQSTRNSNGFQLPVTCRQHLRWQERLGSSLRAVGYDAKGRLTTVTDWENKVTTLRYDAVDRSAVISFADGSTETRSYDARDRIIEIKTAKSGTELTKFAYQYDLAGQILSETATIAGLIRTSSYDAAGQLTSMKDALNRTTSYQYDAAGRKLRVTHPDGAIEQMRYDLAGRIVEQKDALNRATTFGYDQNGRLLSVTDAAGGVTSYGYDGLGSRTQQVDALNRQTQFVYDAAGRMTARSLPMGQTETLQYDRSGNVTTMIGMRGNTISHSYDGAGKLTEKRTNEGRSWTFAYSNTRLVNVVNQQTGQQSTRNSNGLGQLISEYDHGFTLPVTNQFDGRGLRTQVNTGRSPGRATKYGYDAKGRLTTVTDWENKVTTINYDAVDRPASITFADGSVETRAYDARDRIVEIKTSNAGSELTKFAYQYDLAGQITSEVATISGVTRTSSYQYDALSRLTRAQIVEAGQPTTTLVWTYDAVGNRLTQAQTVGSNTVNTTYVYDNNDRLLTETTDQTPIQTTTYSYDDSGNLLRKLTTAGLAPSNTTLADTRYQWDAQDRLTQITEDAHTATPKITKQIYSGFDERIAEILPGTGNEQSRTQQYILDHSFGNAQVIEERLGAGSPLTAHHTLMPFQNAQGVMRISEVRGAVNASLPETPINPVWRRYVTDHQSTTRALLDINSALTDQMSFLPFGEVQRRTGTTATPFQYTGEQQAAAGMTYLRARFMDPRQGRFLGMDPYAGNLRSPLSLNKFNYVHSSPVMGVDPTGRFTIMGVSISVNTSSGLRAVSVAQGKRAIRRILFGRPPKDLGVVGELILDWSVNAAFGHLFDVSITKQEFGQRVHADVKSACSAFNFSSVTLICEPFFDDSGSMHMSPKKGTVGVDVLVEYGGKRVIAFELKTGKSMSQTGFNKRKKYSGVSVIQITIHTDRD